MPFLKVYDWGHQVQLNTKYTKAKTLNTKTKEQRTPGPNYYQEHRDQNFNHYFQLITNDTKSNLGLD